MPLVRWLVPIVTILVLAVQSIGTYASAGVKIDATCCCPDPDTCKCHDHPIDQPKNEMKRCGGAVHTDAPIVVVATLPEPPITSSPIAIARVVAWSPPSIPADRVVVPEKPPF